MKKRVIIGAVLLLMAFVLVQPTFVSAANYSNVGVKTGYYVRYSYANTNTTAYNAFPVNQLMVTVVDLTNTVATITETYSFKNGTGGQVGSFTGDISTGTNGISPWIIPAGLQIGDSVPGMPGAYINSTDNVGDMGGGYNRMVNKLSMSINASDTQYYIDYWWDQETGLLVFWNTRMITAQYPVTTTYTIESTNAWSSSNIPITTPSSEMPLWMIVVITIAVTSTACAVAILLLMKGGKIGGVQVKKPRGKEQ